MTVLLPKLSFRYPADPSKREHPNEFIESADYVSATDSAIRAPVQYINEKIGLTTYAACEGHLDDEQVGHMLDSYISIRFPYERAPLLELLREKGFESKMFRSRCGGYYEMVDDHKVEYKVKTDCLFSKTIYPKDMFRGPDFPPKELVVCGSFATWEEAIRRPPDLCLRVRSTKDLIQPRWDMFRDYGWRYWAGLLSEWKQAQ